MWKSQKGFCSILEKVLLKNVFLCTLFASKYLWHDCDLCGYRLSIPWRILRTGNGGKPKRLAISRALFLPEAEEDTNAATRSKRYFIRHGRPYLTWSSSISVFSNRWTSFMIPVTVKGNIHIYLNSEFLQSIVHKFLIHVKQLLQ